MKLTDERIIEFFWKSPVKSFEAIRDTLRYFDGKWIWEELEYELFNEALGDNPDEKVSIQIPNIGGIATNVLLALTWHAKSFHLIRRRTRKFRGQSNEFAQHGELIAYYELTPAGKEVLKLLDVICQAKEKIS